MTEVAAHLEEIEQALWYLVSAAYLIAIVIIFHMAAGR